MFLGIWEKNKSTNNFERKQTGADKQNGGKKFERPQVIIQTKKRLHQQELQSTLSTA